jgi:twinkle protein
VWIVAHPQKLRRDDSGKLPIPTPDAISGSAHFWNKADNALTVWRDLANPDSQNVEIHVQKVRFKNVGRSGIVDLTWDRITGRYHEPIGLRVVYGEHKE